MKREPLFNAAALVAVSSALIGLAVSFGLPITPEQVQAIQTLVTVLAPFIVVWLGRRKVTPVNDPRDAQGKRLVSVDERADHSS